MSGLQKSGYLEVKQPSNIKGRKLKTWKKKWVVVHKMSNLSSGTFGAKLDLYADEQAAKSTSHDKQTYIFENVTEIKTAQSKTHKLAFEILENEPVLVLSGQDQVDTESWISVLQNIFWPREQIEGEDSFKVFVIESEDSKKNSLYGEYYMTVSPKRVKVKALSRSHELDWCLGSLKRFYLDKENSSALIIESGSKSTFGEAKFKFTSMTVQDILKSIRNNIQIAISNRQSEDDRNRSSSTTDSEKGFKVLLENSERPRSRTVSSGGAAEPTQNIANDSVFEDRHRKVSMVLPPYVSPKTNKQPSFGESLDSKTSEDQTKAVTEESTEHEYNVLNQIENKAESNKRNLERIVSTEKVTTGDNKEVIVSYDERGYSHIPLTKPSEGERTPECNKHVLQSAKQSSPTVKQNSKIPETFNDEVKVRSVSEYSTQSLDIERSSSITSRDSGVVVCASPEPKADNVEPLKTFDRKHHSSNSFDSAISTSSNISASVKEAFVVTTTSNVSSQSGIPNGTQAIARKQSKGNGLDIYCDIDSTRKISDQPTKHESDYEELDKYKKDINKFLGIDPKVKPIDVPPSLPERPSSLVIRRPRERPTVLKGESSKQSRKISLPLLKMTKTKKTKFLAKHSSLSHPSSTDSSSEDEDRKGKSSIANVRNWPIEQKSKSSKNILYESVPGTFNDEEVRARSGSGSFEPITRPRRPSDSTLVDAAIKNGSLKKQKGDPIYSEVKFDSNAEEKTSDSKKQNEEILIPGLASPVIASFVNNSSNSDSDPDSSQEHAVSTNSDLKSVTDNHETEPEGSKLSAPLMKFDQTIDLFHIGYIPDGSSENEKAPFSSDLEAVWNPFPELGHVKKTSVSKIKGENLNSNQSEKDEELFDPFNLGLSTDNLRHSLTAESFQTIAKNSDIHTGSKSLNDLEFFNSDFTNSSIDTDADPYMDMSGMSSSEEVEYVQPDLIRLG